jgi:hypothetical protein
MTKAIIRPILLGLVLSGLLLGLSGCQNLKAEIPHHVVTAAVTQQADHRQDELWSELSANLETAPKLTVKRVKVSRVQPVKVGAELAYEVTGTYQYKLRYPNLPTATQSQVPFDVIVQQTDDADAWQALQQTRQGDRRWSWVPIAIRQESAEALTS